MRPMYVPDRPLYVPVRLAAAVMAVAATAGCMSVGEDGRESAGPSHSAPDRGGAAAPDGGAAAQGGPQTSNGQGRQLRERRTRPSAEAERAEPGADEVGSAAPSASAPKVPVRPSPSAKPGTPVPDEPGTPSADPWPTLSPEPTPPALPSAEDPSPSASEPSASPQGGVARLTPGMTGLEVTGPTP